MPLKNFTYRDWITFTRLTVNGFTWTLPLLGYFIATPLLAFREIGLLLLLATAFHFFAYVTNDIVDLELDRLAPRRATKPLTRRAISPRQALWFALGQLPLMLLLAYLLRQDWQSALWLSLSLGCMTLYNLYGKKSPFPILTDLIQGISWALLVVYGNWVTGQPIQPATYASAAFVIVYIMLMNGVHGSIRDLPTDAAYGVRSTALGFGAAFAAPDRINLPWSLRLYAAFLQLLLVGLSYLPLATGITPYGLSPYGLSPYGLSPYGLSPYGLSGPLVTWLLFSLLACGSFLYLLTQVKITKLAAVGALQAICTDWCMTIALFQQIGVIGCVCLLVVYFAPMLLSDWLFPSFSGQLDLKTVPITTNKR